MAIFLVEYDRTAGNLVSIQEFPAADRNKASAYRIGRELELHKSGVRREVVILEAESESALWRTHQRYFQDVRQLVESGREKAGNLSPSKGSDQAETGA